MLVESIYLLVWVTVLKTTFALHHSQVANFLIFWNETDPFIRISHSSEPDRVLFQTTRHWPFLTVGYATETNLPIVDGNQKLNEWTLFETPYQSIQRVQHINHEGKERVVFSGEVWGLVTRAEYALQFYLPLDSNGAIAPDHLAFNVSLKALQGSVNRIFFNYWCHPQERFYGFGVQYSYFNLKGRRVPIVVAEQGIGRGVQPLTAFLNLFADRAGGDWSTTYAPKPLYITNQNRALLLENSEISFFDMRDDDTVVIEVWAQTLCGRIMYGDSLLSLVTAITSYTGRMNPLPEWTQQGAIVGLQGGTQKVRGLLQQLGVSLDGERTVPNRSRVNEKDTVLPVVEPRISGVWLQDWVGLRHAFDGDRLQWHWTLDQSHYPNWHSDIHRALQDQDISVLGYINPFFAAQPWMHQNLSEVDGKSATLGAVSNDTPARRNLFQEGLENGYFVRNPQNTGPYVLRSGSIEFCMLDLTHPQAVKWMQQIIRDEVVSGAGMRGWMADFAEYLPFDAQLYDSSISAAQFHNLYPQRWAQLNHEAVSTLPLKQKNDMLFFLRSAWTQSPAHVSAFWLGDQLVSWDEHDGLRSSLTAALSGGLCGHSLTHSDIGGYTIQERPPFAYIRTEELLLRWIEQAAFGAAVFRSHMGLSISTQNAQIFSAPRITRHFHLFSHIFAHLADYRKQLMQEAQQLGWPLMRPMSAYFPQDPTVWDLTSQYMFGAELLVAPVLSPAAATDADNACGRDNHVHDRAANNPVFGDLGVACVRVYLPRDHHSGEDTPWVYLWSGEEISVKGALRLDDQDNDAVNGQWMAIDAPIGAPPVFYRVHSAVGERLREFVLSLGLGAVIVESIPSHQQQQKEQQQTASAGSGAWNSRMRRPLLFRERSWVEWLGLSEFWSPSTSTAGDETVSDQTAAAAASIASLV